jgi:phosphohistidine phosphatase
MNLFFLRHGKAFARGPKWRPDSIRPLTHEGEKKMYAIARGIKSLDVSLDLILTSPYARAFRTAEILGEEFDPKKVFESKNLIAEAEPKGVIDEINENFSGLTQIALVGHEPFLSRLISVLISGRDDLSVELRKAGFCKLSVKKLGYGRCAALEWLMTPKQLARLGK